MTCIVFLFPDTNIFLQCRDLEELPWKEVTDSDHVTLIVSRPVQEEVDRLKQNGNARRAKRARRTNSLFRKLLVEGEDSLVIRKSAPRVELVLARPSTVDMPEGLDPTRADDQLVAEALALHSADPEVQVALLTNDTNPAMTARQHGLKFILAPVNWLLDPEPDGRDKQIRNLEERVRRIESSTPQIEIKPFRGEIPLNGPLVINIKKYRAPTEAEVGELIEEARTAVPATVDLSQAQPPKPRITFGREYTYIPPSEDEVSRFEDEEHPAWIQELENFFGGLGSRLEYPSRCACVSISIDNGGSSPALSAVVEFKSTPGLLLDAPDKDDRPVEHLSAISAPTPPALPRGEWRPNPTALEEMAKRFSQSALLGGGGFGPGVLSHLRDPIFPPTLDIKRDRDPHAFFWKPHRPSIPESQWQLECSEFRHRVEPEWFETCLLVDAYNDTEITSACVTVRVTASNLPEPTVMKLPVRVEYTEQGCVEEAREFLQRAVGKGPR